MSANLDDKYSALIQNNCILDMSYHLFQAIPSFENSTVDLNNVNDLIASQITTGRKPGNSNEVAEFVVNNNAKLNITAGLVVDLYEGTDIGFTNSTKTPLATADADVNISINTAHICMAGPVTEYRAPIGTDNGFAGRVAPASTTTIFPMLQNEISVYPNPTTGIFTLYAPSLYSKNYALSITNISGKMIKQWGGKNLVKSKTGVNFSITELPAGIYLLRITYTDGGRVVKIVKK
jgi:hypothetical protein